MVRVPRQSLRYMGSSILEALPVTRICDCGALGQFDLSCIMYTFIARHYVLSVTIAPWTDSGDGRLAERNQSWPFPVSSIPAGSGPKADQRMDKVVLGEALTEPPLTTATSLQCLVRGTCHPAQPSLP